MESLILRGRRLFVDDCFRKSLNISSKQFWSSSKNNDNNKAGADSSSFSPSSLSNENNHPKKSEDFNYPQLDWVDGSKTRDINKELKDAIFQNTQAKAFNNKLEEDYAKAQKEVDNRIKHLDSDLKDLVKDFDTLYVGKNFFGPDHDRQYKNKVKELGGFVDPSAQYDRERFMQKYKPKTWNPYEWLQRFTNTYIDQTPTFSGNFKNPMDKDEACRILGISDANSYTEKILRDHHRRFMRSLHPDTGGNAFLSGKVNEAKFELEKELNKKSDEKKKAAKDKEKDKGKDKDKEKDKEGKEKLDQGVDKRDRRERDVFDELPIGTHSGSTSGKLGGIYDLDFTGKESGYDVAVAWNKADYFIGSKCFIMGPLPLRIGRPKYYWKMRSWKEDRKNERLLYTTNIKNRTKLFYKPAFDRVRLRYWPLLHSKIFKPNPNNIGKNNEYPIDVEAVLTASTRGKDDIMLKYYYKKLAETTGMTHQQMIRLAETNITKTQNQSNLPEELNKQKTEEEIINERNEKIEAENKRIEEEMKNRRRRVQSSNDINNLINQRQNDINESIQEQKKEDREKEQDQDPDKKSESKMDDPEELSEEEYKKRLQEQYKSFGGKDYDISDHPEDLEREHIELWDPLFKNEKSPWFPIDIQQATMESMLRRQDLKTMHRTNSQHMLNDYKNSENIDPVLLQGYETDYQIDQDNSTIGKIRQFSRRNRRQIELESEIQRRVDGDNVPDSEREAFLNNRLRIEQEFEDKRVKQIEERRMELEMEGYEPERLYFLDIESPSELEAIRHERFSPKIDPTSEWEYKHWFEGEPEDYEQRFQLNEDEVDELLDFQKSQYDRIANLVDSEEPIPNRFRYKRKGRRKNLRRLKFRITPVIQEQVKRNFRYKASIMWDKWEDYFFYAAWPKSSFSHLEHDPSKIFYPNVPNKAEEQQIKEKQFEKYLFQLDYSRTILEITQKYPGFIPTPNITQQDQELKHIFEKEEIMMPTPTPRKIFISNPPLSTTSTTTSTTTTNNDSK